MPNSVSHTYRPVKQNFRLFFSGDPFILPAMALGDQIKRARLAKGISQQAIATHFGISRAAVAQWENSTTRPDQDKLAGLARLLDIGLDALLSGDDHGPTDGHHPIAPDAYRELLAALEYLLPQERAELEAEIRRRADHNKAVGEMLAREQQAPPRRPPTAVMAGPMSSIQNKKQRRKTGS